MFENISNQKTTNIFESYTGHLNVAPIRISGQYKIVVTSDDKLYLDDYNGRRIPIDMTKKFLPQVANFMRIKTTVVDEINLRYGGFQRITKKYYHIPIYINRIRFHERLPRFAVVSRVINEEIDATYKLQKYGDLIRVADMDKLGLTSIMEEILNECPDYPVYMNLDERQYTIYGYSINDECWTQKTIDTTYIQANQTYIDVVNYKIEKSFEDNNIFFPRFLNIEFEFEFTDNLVPFNNFYGYLSYGENINVDQFNGDYFTINVKEYKDYIIWKQEKYVEKLQLEKYVVELGNVTALKATMQNPQIRFRCPTINNEDYFTIYNPDGTIYFQHVVITNEIYPDSLYKTLFQLCKKMTKETGGNFEFSIDERSIIRVKSNVADIYEEQYRMDIPQHCVMLDRYEGDDNYNYFRGITSYDIRLSQEIQLEEDYLAVEIREEYYRVVDRFKYDDKPYIRCVNVNDVTEYAKFDNNADVIFLNVLESKLYKLSELPFYTVDADLKVERQFDKQNYINELHNLFDENPFPEPTQEQIEANDAFHEAVDHFSKRDFVDTLPYIKDDETLMESVETDTVVQDDNNDVQIKTMMFNSFGQTGFISPNILNYEKQMYLKNGNPDYYLQDTDTYAFHWFLIKGRCPEYLKTGINQLRYFGGSDDEIKIPKLTSRIIRVNDNYCETIFLGVKYQLPTRYENYQFATYLDFHNELDTSLNYRFEIDDRAHTIYLVIARYIDFCDLIRGGFRDNEPLIDLSFFYSVTAPYNSQSDFLDGFSASGLLICDETVPVMFNGKDMTGWRAKYNNEWYVCVKNSPTAQYVDFRELFPAEGNGTFYLYSNLEYNGVNYNYISTTIKFMDIYDVQENYLWCKDVVIRFFDTKNIFMQKMIAGIDEWTQEWFHVPHENVLNYVDESDAIFGDYVKIANVLIKRYDKDGNDYNTEETLHVMLPDKAISLKENYFIIFKDNAEIDDSGNRQETWSYFYFPEFFHPEWGLNDLLDHFKCESLFDSFISGQINKEYGRQNLQRIDLFDRNQVWYFIREYISFDAMFKYTSEAQIRRFINQFLIINLAEYAAGKSIPILKNNDEIDEYKSNKFGYVNLSVVGNDYNSVIWNMITQSGYINKVIDIARYKAPYLPYLKLLDSQIDFQNKKYRNTGKLFNIYDPNFGGDGVNATGLWNEITGNVVSSLFCKDTDISIVMVYSQTVNYREIFKQQLKLDEAIIINDNKAYIETIDQNVYDYILEQYIDYLFFNFYYFAGVTNELGQNLKYTTDKKNQYVINLPKLSSYETNFNYMKLNFVRK